MFETKSVSEGMQSDKSSTDERPRLLVIRIQEAAALDDYSMRKSHVNKLSIQPIQLMTNVLHTLFIAGGGELQQLLLLRCNLLAKHR